MNLCRMPMEYASGLQECHFPDLVPISTQVAWQDGRIQRTRHTIPQYSRDIRKTWTTMI